MYVLTNVHRGIGQKKCILDSCGYALCQKQACIRLERPSRSFRTKWGDLKVSIAKFLGFYEHIKAWTGVDE